ncbi:hypothetical protein B0A49_02104 [Cryomyces minteri]|uniref:Uracil-DNA glycosylase-like domain-containing protein n=1 Tax=Cryomyces minteri TaxID=331657 RepID=A0A4U0XSJ5_9PEZI|nr:hypothetical protein B0A49_02104 [Cryomyces minteri]
MVHTRAAAAASKTQGDIEPPAKPSPSFKGGLEQFQYAPATSIDPDATRARKVLSVKNSSANRQLKRPRGQDTEDNADLDSKGSPSPSSSKKKKRTPSKYADPSKYAHLPTPRDVLKANLICVFVGTNPGIRTATAGHAYAHPSNLFWKLLHSSGCTDRRCKPEEDVHLPRLYAMGNTNIVERPSKDAAELSKAEMAAGTPILEAKILKYKPEAVCIVGKGIWESVWRYRYGRPPKASEFKYGWQDEKENLGKSEGEEVDGEGNLWKGAKVFVATSTSGLSASTRPAEKEAIWKPFGEWVKGRRAERMGKSGT